MATYLVTGAAGFIGSHLVDALLAAGHTVRGLDDLSTGRVDNLDPRCVLVRGDVADAETVLGAMQGVDGCFHLAAIASVARGNEEWLETHRVNQTGTVQVLDAARAAGRLPVVYASSAAVYGPVADIADESRAPAPITAYGADKFGSELHARVGAVVHGVPTVGLRFFNVYGPRQDPHSPYSGVISIFARRIVEGRSVEVHGDGSQTRDFIYVADVVRHLVAAMRHAAEQGGSHVFNVCTGHEVSVIELARTLARLSGQPERITNGQARPGDIARSVGAPERAVAALGVRASTKLMDGLQLLLGSAPAGAGAK